MHNSAWNDLTGLFDGKDPGYRPAGFIIDSPWIPEWYGISTIDYYSSDELWFRANLHAAESFPGLWFMPGFWPEYGMCTEPSAFGSRMIFPEKNLPHAEKILTDIDESNNLPTPDVRTDGLLPFVISRLRNNHARIMEADHQVRFAISRGPLNIAGFLLGTTELMTSVTLKPEASHLLLGRMTDFICDWLRWQKECFPSIEGIFILDDIIGFLGESEFRDFVIPCLKRIFSSFPSKIRFLHNDAEGLITAKYLDEMHVNMFNFSFMHSMGEIRRLAGPDKVLVGNIPPRDILASGTPGQVREVVKSLLKDTDDLDRVILSAGGGMPPGVTSENIHAFIDEISNYQYRKDVKCSD